MNLFNTECLELVVVHGLPYSALLCIVPTDLPFMDMNEDQRMLSRMCTGVTDIEI